MRMKLFWFIFAILRVHFSLFDVGCRLDWSWSWGWGCCNWGVSHRNPIIMCNQYFCSSSSSGSGLCLSCMRPERMCLTADQLETGSDGRNVCSTVWSADNKEIFKADALLFVLIDRSSLIAVTKNKKRQLAIINRYKFKISWQHYCQNFSIKTIDSFSFQLELSLQWVSG